MYSFLRYIACRIACCIAPLAAFLCLYGGDARGQLLGEGNRFVGAEDDGVRFYLSTLDVGSYPSYLNVRDIVAATQAALNAWNGVFGSRLHFELMAIRNAEQQLQWLTSPSREPRDAHSVLPIFVMSREDPLYGFAGFEPISTKPPSFAARTYAGGSPSGSFNAYTGGVLKACDILLNAVDYTWSTLQQTPAEDMDLQSALMHEIGRCMGLPVRTAYEDRATVMYSGFTRGTWRRALHALDKEALSTFYPVGGPGARCDSNAHCLTGVCALQQVHNTLSPRRYCTPPCYGGASQECPLPTRCELLTTPLFQNTSRACLLPSLLDTPVGNACTQNAGCTALPASMCMEGRMWPGGYCSQPCDFNWEACPAGSTCLPLGGVKWCVRNCAVRGNDCRAGYVCYPHASEDEGLCFGKCAGNGDCGQGFVCRSWDGRCIAQQDTSARLGKPCEKNEECYTGQECRQLPSLPQKICTARCRPGEPPCPGGSLCVALEEKEELVCLSRCESRAACLAAGMQCAPTPQGNVCFPPCQTWEDCPEGSTQCEEGQCQSPGREGPGEGTQLGEIKPDEKATPSKNASSGCTAGGAPGGLGGIYLALAVGIGLRLRRKGLQ